MPGRRAALIGALTAAGVAVLLTAFAVDVALAADLQRMPLVTGHGYSAHAAKQKKKTRHALCSSLVSLGAVQAATGLPGTRLTRKPLAFDTREGSFWAIADTQAGSGASLPGSLPGSECVYDDPTPGTSYTQTVFDMLDVPDDYVAVGYGESRKHWRAFESVLRARGGGPGGPFTSNDIPTSELFGHAPVSALGLGHSSRAFLMTGNLVAAQDAEPGATFPNPGPHFPTVYYVVSVMTKRDDVLQVGLYSSGGLTAAAALTAAKSLVTHVLSAEPGF